LHCIFEFAIKLDDQLLKTITDADENAKTKHHKNKNMRLTKHKTLNNSYRKKNYCVKI